MKRRTIFTITFITLLFTTSYAQDNLSDIGSTFNNKVSSLDILGGIHAGAFDCNQTNKYPFNFGANAIAEFTPNTDNPWYVGFELGIFYVKGDEEPDNYGRKINMTLINGFLHAGYKFKLVEGSESAKPISMKLALGLPYVDQLSSISTGKGYVDPVRSLGLGFMGMIELPNRISLFGSLYRLNKDIDGFGNDEAGNIISGNESQATYIYKFGIMWSLLSK